jgi:hypothetical protein
MPPLARLNVVVVCNRRFRFAPPPVIHEVTASAVEDMAVINKNHSHISATRDCLSIGKPTRNISGSPIFFNYFGIVNSFHVQRDIIRCILMDRR